MSKWKNIAIFELFLIIIGAIFIINLISLENKQEINNQDRLLSSRIYAGILEPQSHLIYNFDELEDSISARIQSENKKVSVYLQNLRDGASMGVNEDAEFEPASLNKLIMAIIIMKKVENGVLSLEEQLLVKEEDIDKASGTIYKRVGEHV